jgi:outer membrane protein assembly factor BamB
MGAGAVHDAVHPYGDAGSEGRLFLGTRSLVRRRLAELPPEAIEAYRQRHEDAAREILDLARATSDEAALREVVDVYPLCTAAYHAGLALADLAFERGDFPLAERRLRALLYETGTVIDTGQRAAVTARLALSYASQGATPELLGLLEMEEPACGDELVLVRGHEEEWRGLVSGLSRGTVPELVPGRRPSWATFLGNNTRTLTGPALAGDFQVAFRLPVDRTEVRPVAKGDVLEWPSPLLPDYPVVDEESGTAYLASREAILAVEVGTGKVIWSRRLSDILQEVGLSEWTPVMALAPAFTRPRHLSLAGATLLATLEATPRMAATRRPVKLLLALDRYRGGDVIWSAGGHPWSDPLLSGCEIAAAPVVWGSRVFVGGRKITESSSDRKVYVLGLSLETGVPELWTFLCSGPNASAEDRESETPFLSEAGGVIYCSTGLGVIAAASADTGEVLWLFRYERSPWRGPQGPITLSFRNPWRDDPLFIAGNRLYSTPPDSSLLHVLFLCPEAGSGALRNDKIPKDNLDYVLGVDSGWIFLAGRSSDGKSQIVRAIYPDARTSALQWEFVVPNPLPEREEMRDRLFGRGILAEDVVIVPTIKALYSLDKWTGGVVRVSDRDSVTGEPIRTGNVVPARDGLLLAAPDRLEHIVLTR